MLIPIFGSSPTHLNDRQFKIKKNLLGELGRAGLEWRSLGQTDYPHESPLLEVLTLAQHCSGGLVLGFSQFVTDRGTWLKGTPFARAAKAPAAFPTAWNNLEAGILFSLRLPLLVFREKRISGGIFDVGVTDLFIQDMPSPSPSNKERQHLREVFRKWAAKVQDTYYNRPHRV